MMRSLRTRLFMVWTLSLAASVAVGVLLVQLYQQSNAAFAARAEAELARGCDLILDRYSYYVSGWNGPVPPPGDLELQRDLGAVTTMALGSSSRLRAGILRDPADITPPTPLSQLAASALSADQPIIQRNDANGVTQLAAVCPLGGPIPNLAGWVATDVIATPGTSLTSGLAVLGSLVLVLSGGLTWLIVTWSRHIGRIERALGRQDAQGGLPRIAPTGEAELDRIIAALNDAGLRLRAAQNAADAAAQRAARAERMAALGRVAAGVAHEIRNPIAAMRLRAEGALARGIATDPARAQTALGAILGQIERLDRLSGELLAMTQRGSPEPVQVDLATFLHGCALDHATDALTPQVVATGLAWFDPAMIRRALDNLVQNAMRHTSEGGSVTLTAAAEPGQIRLVVADTGPGIDPSVRDTLFEPFVTSRADGTGLGLAIAREMAQAHGGTLVVRDDAHGAVFTLTLPQQVEATAP